MQYMCIGALGNGLTTVQLALYTRIHPIGHISANWSGYIILEAEVVVDR